MNCLTLSWIRSMHLNFQKVCNFLLQFRANFSIALLNLALLLPMLFEKHVIRSVLRFIFLAVILLPVFVILGYYSVTSTVFAPDTLLAIAQTNIQEAIEYAKDNFSCKTIFLIILANASVFFVAIKNTQKILWNKYNLNCNKKLHTF